jgi:hypothetical protein
MKTPGVERSVEEPSVFRSQRFVLAFGVAGRDAGGSRGGEDLGIFFRAGVGRPSGIPPETNYGAEFSSAG